MGQRYERKALDGPACDSTAGALSLKRAVDLQSSYENARAPGHLFERLLVKRAVLGELDDSEPWSELRGRGLRNGRLPGPGSAENDRRAPPMNGSDQPANKATTGQHARGSPRV